MEFTKHNSFENRHRYIKSIASCARNVNKSLSKNFHSTYVIKAKSNDASTLRFYPFIECSVFKSLTFFHANGLLLLTRTCTHNQLQCVPSLFISGRGLFSIHAYADINTFMVEAIAIIRLASLVCVIPNRYYCLVLLEIGSNQRITIHSY